jgi:hypothetical protein
MSRERSERKVGHAVPEKISQAILQKPISCLHVTVVTPAAQIVKRNDSRQQPQREVRNRAQADLDDVLENGNDEVRSLKASYHAARGPRPAFSRRYFPLCKRNKNC